MHRAENPSSMRKGLRQLEYAQRAQVGELSAAKVPRRDAVRFNPKAKLNSLPRNQRARAVVTATFNDSAPIPKMRRPVAIRGRCPDAAVIAGPTNERIAKIMSAFRNPIRSMMKPPMTTVKMLGKLYIAWRK